MPKKFRCALVALGAAAALFCAFAIALKRSLPPIYSLADYQPMQASEVFSTEGVRIGTFAIERRTVVPYEAFPEHLVHAFLAAEDADFFEHEGIDWVGVGRALLKNLRPGAHLQGASTITQQIVKTLVLGPERSLWRKAREAVLARRLEQMLGKHEILALYLNQIYFGHGAWGVEQAAQTYFAKSVPDVTVAESALLAAIPKNPSRYTLLGDRRATKQRQAYVLEQMVAHGWITRDAATAAQQAPLPAMPSVNPAVAASAAYVEHVRRQLMPAYGHEQLTMGGLKIYTHLSLKDQWAATRGMQQALEEVAQRHGFVGPRGHIEADASRAVRAHLAQRLQQVQTTETDPVLAGGVWDLSEFARAYRAHGAPLPRAVGLVPALPYQRTVALVSALPAQSDHAVIDLGTHTAHLKLARMAWARPYQPERATPRPKRPSDVLHVGDLIAVELVQAPKKGGVWEVALVAEPRVQGALVSMAPPYGAVRAMVAGAEGEAAMGFNRATQARRQPGSAFKPILYAAALEDRVITPATLCADSPVVITEPGMRQAWKPENYEDGRYDGNIPYRTALARSKNTCSVRLLQRVGLPALTTMAQRLGMAAAWPQSLTLALGTGEVTPLDMAAAMHAIANRGQYEPPRFVSRVVDARGEILAVPSALPKAGVAMSEATAFVLTSMMRSVVESGTARRAQVLGRPIAAKTGTSQWSRDAWVVGFAPTLASAVWVGLDDDTSMGRETGGSAALPAWVRYMGTALADEPVSDFVLPDGVVAARIDPRTGAASSGPESVVEVFLAGTEPIVEQAETPSIYLEDD